jgi:hypothetical protein
VFVGVGGRVGVDVTVAGYTGSPSGPTGTIVGESGATDTLEGELTGVVAICHASLAPASASIAGCPSAVEAEAVIERPRFIARAKATVQMLTVASPNTNKIS